MSIVSNIKNDATVINGGEDDFPRFNISIEDIENTTVLPYDIKEKVCSDCRFCDHVSDLGFCVAGDIGDGEIVYDFELEAFVCVEAVKQDLFGSL